jgi:hypothetical protein
MTTKSAVAAPGAPVSPAFVRESPVSEGLTLFDGARQDPGSAAQRLGQERSARCPGHPSHATDRRDATLPDQLRAGINDVQEPSKTHEAHCKSKDRDPAPYPDALSPPAKVSFFTIRPAVHGRQPRQQHHPGCCRGAIVFTICVWLGRIGAS